VEHAQRPKTDEARNALAAVLGAAAQARLHALEAAVDPPWRREVPAVNTRRQVWAAQSSEVKGKLGWREGNDRPAPAALLPSPADPEARDSTKRELEWGGIQST
jgi:hypothetical protein